MNALTGTRRLGEPRDRAADAKKTVRQRAAGSLRDRRSLLWFSLAGLTVLSAAIMLVDLGRKPLWHDEAFTGYVATRSTSTMFAILAKREGNMPLYYVMEHVWSSGGTSPLWLRLPSALAVVATIPVTVLIGRRVFGNQVALTAGLLLTLNGFLVHYGREARTYGLVTLLAAVTTLFLLEIVNRQSKRLWFAYVGAALLMIGAQPLSAFLILIAHGTSLVLAPPLKSERRAYITALGALLSLNCIVMLYIVVFQSASTDFIQPTRLIQLAVFAYDLAGGGALRASATLVGSVLGVCFIALGLSAVLAVVRGSRQVRGVQRWQQVMMLSWSLLPPLLLLTVSVVRPSWRERYLTVVTPAVVLLVAFGIYQLRNRAIRVAVLAAVLALSSISVVHTLRQKAVEDLPAGATMLLSRTQPGDAIVYSGAPTRTPFQWIAQQVEAGGSLPTDIALAPGGQADDIHDLFAKEVDPPTLTSRLGQRRRVWVVSLPKATWHPTPEPMQTVQKSTFWRDNFRKSSQQDFGGLRIELYQRIVPAAG